MQIGNALELYKATGKGRIDVLLEQNEK